MGDVASEQTCLHFLQKDLEIADRAISKLVTVPLHPNTTETLRQILTNNPALTRAEEGR